MRRAVAYTTGAQLAIQAIGLVTGILVARWLGPDGRGQLAAVIAWAAMLTYLGNLGLPVAFAYAAAREPQRRHQIFGNGVLSAAAQWLVLALLGIIILPMVLARHDPTLVHLAVLYLCAYIPLNLLSLYAIAIQQGSTYYGVFNALRLSVPVGYILLLGLFWAIHLISVESVVVANLLSNVITMTLALTLTLPPLLRLRRTSGQPWTNAKALREDLRYGLSAQIGTLQPFSGLQLDVLALTLMAATHDLGLYMAALAAASVIRAQGYALGQVALPEVAKREHRHDQWRIISRLMLLAAVGGAIVFAIVLVWAVPLLRLVYGEAFTAAAPMLKILVLAGTLGAVYRVLADGLRGMGRPLVSTVAELVGLGVGIPALAICIPLWGAQGAAIAVLIASVISLLVALWMSLRPGNGRDVSQSRITLDRSSDTNSVQFFYQPAINLPATK